MPRWAAEFSTPRMAWCAVTAGKERGGGGREEEHHGFLPGEHLLE